MSFNLAKQPMERVLVIDDDVGLCELVGEYLEPEGYTVEAIHNGERGIDRALSDEHDLVVLDVMLPGTNGFDVLRRIRARSRIPVLMLTARGDDVDRIVGLELGADDYLSKPFNARELVARIRAVSRRLHSSAEEHERLEINGVVLDIAAREVHCRGSEVALTTLEFEILKMLMQAVGRVLTRDHIMELLYNRDAGPFDRSVDLHVSHLRRKLGREGAYIRTVRGVGYQFARRFAKDGEQAS